MGTGNVVVGSAGTGRHEEVSHWSDRATRTRRLPNSSEAALIVARAHRGSFPLGCQVGVDFWPGSSPFAFRCHQRHAPRLGALSGSQRSAQGGRGWIGDGPASSVRPDPERKSFPPHRLPRTAAAGRKQLKPLKTARRGFLPVLNIVPRPRLQTCVISIMQCVTSMF